MAPNSHIKKGLKFFAVFFGADLLLQGCNKKETPDTLFSTSYDLQAMELAIDDAQRKIDVFLAELAKPTGTDHCVKVPISDRGEVEHFWISNLTYKNGEFKGVIANDPATVTNVKVGQSWTVKKSDISDWLFMRDGKMHGNYTLRVLIKSMPEREAAENRARLAED